MHYYYAYVYVRIMQAMGAYGFRGFYERKAHFLESVPYAMKNLRWLLHRIKLPIALPALTDAFKGMLGSESSRASLPEERTWRCAFSAFRFIMASRKMRAGMAADTSSTPAAAQSRTRRGPSGFDGKGRAGNRLSQ